MHLVLEADRFLADLNERAPDLDMSPPAFEATSRSRGLPDEKRSAVWNKGPISIDLRTVGVELEVSTCFLTDGVWSVGGVYDASALNQLLSTAIGRGTRRFGRSRGREGAASLSHRREYDRIDSEIGRVSKSSDPFAAAVRAARMSSTIASSQRTLV